MIYEVESQLRLYDAMILPYKEHRDAEHTINIMRQRYDELTQTSDTKAQKINESWDWMRKHAARSTRKHKKPTHTDH